MHRKDFFAQDLCFRLLYIVPRT